MDKKRTERNPQSAGIAEDMEIPVKRRSNPATKSKQPGAVMDTRHRARHKGAMNSNPSFLETELKKLISENETLKRENGILAKMLSQKVTTIEKLLASTFEIQEKEIEPLEKMIISHLDDLIRYRLGIHRENQST